MSELPEWVKPGAAFVYVFTPDNVHHGRKFHIRGIVDGMVVMREWWRRKRRWNYTVEDPLYFKYNGHHLKVVRR
ncbi:hypothetical protein [Mesorhizobium silamurunense]|uniref:hypothetical protein n=1 Tax=Mesorhizobium silamurunense TaxID=499528 RepID=UPI00177F5007|nr:hypothetical protein [Mesorhizobium silamurunense]